jgi:hypothetical protein
MRRERSSKRVWWILVVLVLLIHLALVLFVRPEFFHYFLRDIDEPAGAGARHGSASPPDAIIAIRIDVEAEDPAVPPAERATASLPEIAKPSESPQPGNEDALESIDLGELLGETRAPRAGRGAGSRETIPPRPVEITWPETRRLKHCIGRHIDVRILVDEDGAIRRVEPQSNDLPPDCLQSALDAAGKIKFSPGRVDGKPAALWAQVRIDFEEKR